MVWGRLRRGLVRCFLVGASTWALVSNTLLAMEDLMTKFTGITEEDKLIVVNQREAVTLKSSRFFLVGRVLSHKLVNKEGFKRHMRNLWHPKTNVAVMDLEDNRFVFGFNPMQKRTTILRGGPWLYNKQCLLVLGEADSLTYPARILLFFQEFWVQFKGIPLGYMTRHMGEFLGNILGDCIRTDQSRKDELFGRFFECGCYWM
ncbi:hypothetical protein TB1_032301 [Malus domestica]